MVRTVNPAELRELIQALADGRWHSGVRLAQNAGLTRAGLAKRVHKLAEFGLAVETRIGQGYRLAQGLELLEADAVIGALPPEIRARLRVEVLFSTDSTNRRLIESDAAADPRALIAEHQTAGRGRRGRAWHSPFGANLYLSLSWNFPQWPAQITALPLAIGVATAQALQPLGLRGLQLKWPNDLTVGGRKLGGILIEQRGEAGGACRAVIGLGLNVSMRADSAAGIDQPWVSLEQALAAPPPSRHRLAAGILEQWVGALDRFAADGFAPLAGAWQKLDATFGQQVTVHAEPPFSGIAKGVDEVGALKVEVAGETRRVLAGDVSLRIAP